MSNLLFPAALAVVGGALYYANKSGSSSNQPRSKDVCIDFRAQYKDVSAELRKKAVKEFVDNLRFWQTEWKGHTITVSMIGQHQPLDSAHWRIYNDAKGFLNRVRRGPEKWMFTVCGQRDVCEAFVTAVQARSAKR